MKAIVITILFFCTTQFFYSQEEDGVVSLALPIRNSLTYNQYAINPTFSFVRQQNKYISITNKREWIQFENAPLTYLASYSGRFRENIGIGVGLFQQNYGVLTTFGGIVNFAYNAQLNRDSNLTFGINVGAYSSGINNGNVVTNNPDPSLDNIPSNFLLSVSPGINYGTAFVDFGVTINNAILYNFSTSELIQDNPEQGIQGHIMYTGYMYSNSFIDESKFTGLARVEFRDENTNITGTAMLTIPMGIWAQVGYSSLYGLHGGFGLNITQQISIEYNYEKAMGSLSNFGSAHELTLAYKFANKERYDYSREDDVSGLFTTNKKKKNTAKPTNTKAEANRKASAIAKAEAEEQARIAAEAKAQQEAQEQARIAAEAKAQQEAQEQARITAEAKAQQEAQEQARIAAEAKAQQEAQEQARIAAEAKAQQKAQEQARIAAEAKAQQEAQEQARIAAEAKAQQEAQEQARIAAEAKVQQEAQEQARIAAEAKAQQEAQEQARIAAETKAQQEAQEQARIAAEAKAQQEAQEQERIAAEAKAQQEAQEQANENIIPEATDALAKSMNDLANETENSKEVQADLLNELKALVASKDQDLKDLKEENDLSEQGIYMEPKPFKSISAENAKLEAIKSDLDNAIKSRSSKIKELEELYEQRQQIDTIEMDEVSLFYKKTIQKLKSEQATAIKTKTDLEAQLIDIKVATDYERKRRIKRAAYKNEEDRYSQDRATLKAIKENTELSSEPLTKDDFDFGEERSGNIEIMKNVANVDEGYYMILAVHNDVSKRDEFLRKAVASGESNINFFYDVNTSKYYIYANKFDNINEANQAQKTKGLKAYNNKMSIVKIED
ncbi:PorP/SprF family type IX secretion system membrane protein [Hanstruepera ponticola]|uniref:PorP/SprF family type IX secretion system membrane protein n=1 Tax=Hanstruepera ponticola TaxID=2042995 RepID=UPI000CF1AA2C|nr:type IX secretion system membrane protein PorP/SprF [Hanstruepera ponticola]